MFHPESARIARLASGGRYGFAQSVFQVGGNFGTSMGPVLAALIVVPFGQPSIAWFSSIAFLAIVILWRIGHMVQAADRGQEVRGDRARIRMRRDSRRVMIALAVLVALLFSKQLYVSSLSSYYIFYLIDKFGVSTQAAQLYLFIFLAANAVGAFFGGPLGDRFGRKYVIWFSILGALPFTLALPYAGLYASAVLTVFIGLIISSATSSIIVFAQELMPHRFGMISGVFFGVAFGIGGLGAAVLGERRRPYRHRLRLSGLRVSAGDRVARGVPAEDADEARALKRGARRAFASRTPPRFINTLLAIVAASPFFVAHCVTCAAKKSSERLSTLKIRVKWRLSIWCHRPTVSF